MTTLAGGTYANVIPAIWDKPNGRPMQVRVAEHNACGVIAYDLATGRQQMFAAEDLRVWTPDEVRAWEEGSPARIGDTLITKTR